nr:exosome complex component RRP41-like protein [Cryptomonas sp.]
MTLCSYFRLDGRNFNEHRPVRISDNPVPSSIRSIQFSIGFTTVIVAIYRKFDEFDLEKNRPYLTELKLDSFHENITEKSKKYFENSLRKIIDKMYPWEQLKCKIILNLILIDDDGDFISVGLNAICLAIEKAGFFVNIQILFSSVALLKNEKDILINPSKIEEFFTMGNFYFTHKKYNIKKGDNHYKIFYCGQLFTFSENIFNQITKTGEKSLKLLSKLIYYKV